MTTNSTSVVTTRTRHARSKPLHHSKALLRHLIGNLGAFRRVLGSFCADSSFTNTYQRIVENLVPISSLPRKNYEFDLAYLSKGE